MNKQQRKAMELALEALVGLNMPMGIWQAESRNKALTALKEALAHKEPEQEPVGMVKDLFTNAAWDKLDVLGSTKVYLSTPPQLEQRSVSEHLEPVAIHQFRSPPCADWYDGIPDHHDGHGPYEVRTLYTAPPQRSEASKPLTDAQIGAILEDPNIAEKYHGNWLVLPYAYARAIEDAHDIKE